MAIPLILDVDTGSDDALALMLAVRHPDADLRAVTCVAGNAPVAQVLANTRYVLDTAGAPEIPVAAGAARPLLAPPNHAPHVHGVDGLNGFSRPSDRRASDLPAIELLRTTLVAAAAGGRPMTMVPLAPLTTIALLLRAHPEVAAGIDRIVLMGGSTRGGNATAAAEFNIWHDPEAAAIVFAACRELDIPITMYGLDVFERVRVDRTTASDLMGRPDAAAQLAGHLLDARAHQRGTPDASIGDAGAVCAVLDPDGLTCQNLPVRIEVGYGAARGQTIVDRRGRIADMGAEPSAAVPPTLVDVALDVDADRCRQLWLSMF